MLTGKQKRYLRALAHHLQPVMQIGKSGLTGGVLQQVDLELETKELVKVSVLETSPVSRDEIAQMVVEETGAEWVQSMGRTIVFYRKSTENPEIELPT
ncbi:ribosome assembly RNA-binding protein YhbY [Alicyclobacillus mengziensis]|uniref:Ribosome assembly RNA-binding protein YhbY n=1 Tax=Alicyclobacillus mengziensis TaxID=2931921 RepID=A0A9X7VYN8_9BACL|nr:ribosome assembly RNA-binding protein YhbY [Alicyclobacillus mengziensis]QSO46133.1 ribosome assembly RNA-binding protein YhbY [Alicyclobacillus mengziensis]